MTANAYRQLTARYAGTCYSCNLPVIAGQEILYRPADRRVHHNACPISYRNDTTPVSAPMTQQQAIANLKVNTPVSNSSATEGRKAADAFHALIREYSSDLPATGRKLTATTDQETAPQAPEQAEAVTGINDGYYTVVRDNGTHVTFRIRTQAQDANFAPGKQIIATLTGADNTNDYIRWGFINGTQVAVWSKMQNQAANWKPLAEALINGNHKEAGITYATVSGNCYRCNRLLTVVSSINAGLGPVCAGKS